MKMHCKSAGQASCAKHPYEGTINHEPLCAYFSIYPSRHPSLSQACWCHTDGVVKNRGLTMRRGTWVTSATAKWWIIQFRRSKEINIFGRWRTTSWDISSITPSFVSLCGLTPLFITQSVRLDSSFHYDLKMQPVVPFLFVFFFILLLIVFFFGVF